MLRAVPKPNFKRRKPTRKERNNFSKKVREQILERDENKCQQCGGIGTQIHHVVPRGRSGRGVYTNGLTVCNSCHYLIHREPNLLNEWIKHFKSFYGKDFYKDEWDE